MFNQLTALGYGLVIFAVVIGIGTIILVNFSSTTSGCSGLTACGSDGFFNTTALSCYNLTASCGDSTEASTVNTVYLTGQLGSSGLAGWTPAIIAVAVGVLFLGAFMIGGAKGRY